ncbi:MAG: peptide MFS transporter [Microscillaceae bacterium]|nr:peptide MFS transporter [Microscillaceae bacterium]
MTNTDKAFFGHPLGLAILFFTELWERFSYYGMRAILVLFLTSQANGGYGWTNNQALDLYGWYTMLVYVMSIPGGIIADKLWGQKRTVMVGGGLLVIGHLMLAIPSKIAFFTGLAFIVLGVGGLKPNISTMVGGLYRKGDMRRDTGFTIFYIGINTGSFLASIIVSAVGEIYGWHYGFSLAGLGMLAGQLVFIFGQKYLKGIGEEVSVQTTDSKIHTEALDDFSKNTQLSGQEKDRILAILISLVIVLVFWMAFEQAGGLMNLYTKQYTNRDFFGLFVIPTGVFQALNAGFIMIFGGIVAVFWDSFVRRGKHIGGIFKMGFGTMVMGTGFIFMVAAAMESEVSATGEVIRQSSAYWLVLAYLFHTLGELCLSPVSLSFITKVSPKHMVATMMGIYWAVIGFGNKLAAEVGKYAESLGEFTVFLGLVIFPIVMGGLLVLFSNQISKLTHGTEEVNLEKTKTDNILERN